MKSVSKWPQRKKSHEIKVDVRLSVIKPLHAKSIVQCYDYIMSKAEIVTLMGDRNL